MHPSNSFTVEELKLKLKELISKRIVDMIADKSLPYSQIRDTAVAITTSLPEVKTIEDFSVYLDEVLEEYPFLKNEVTLLRHEINRLKEVQVIDRLKSLISNYNNN
jgi:hypothetical protein